MGHLGLGLIFGRNEKPELVFNATSCGENCAKWLLKIGEKQDIEVNE